MNKILSYMFLLLLFFGCSKQMDTKQEVEPLNSDVNTSLESLRGVEKGVIAVKLKRYLGDNIEISKNSLGQLSTPNPQLNSSLRKFEANKMERMYPDAGKFEKRTRREGLHLWYYVYFDESKNLPSALSTFDKLDVVEIAEPIYKLKQEGYVSFVPSIPSFSTMADEDERSSNFDDPELRRQWHYNNKGESYGSRFVEGADINLFKAWEIETGKPNVIVCVVDGGVDVDHEDLQDNMWVNEAELNGIEGVDDDGNGYIDDINGWNLVRRVGEIDADNHGTHVAGTVAARNNNNIGVCGVAGGNGTPNSGVRIMTCQMFLGKKSADGGNGIKYGADNGAVISQNSWGFTHPNSLTDTPQYLKDAIDYFTKYAGCDNDGNQLPNSPMKGGVVFFAAGNDDIDGPSYPAHYYKNVAISSYGPSLRRAYYTNRGDWVDVCAPGGDYRHANEAQVYSTVSNNGYAYMQGTSMACPHVSGIAGLVVSKFGGQGFTNTELRRRIETSLRPFDINAINQQEAGRLGVGYVDAYLALMDARDNKAPKNIDNINSKVSYKYIDLSWIAVEDENDKSVNNYNLYYSTSEINDIDAKSVTKVVIPAAIVKSGTEMKYKLENLEFNTTYYIGLEAEDRWGAKSALKKIELKTKKNNPPVVSLEEEYNVKITGTEKALVKVIVDEKDDDQTWTYKLSGDKKGVSEKLVGNVVEITFRAVAAYGDYKLKLEATDEFGATGTIVIPYTIYKNHPPKLVKKINKLFIPLGKNKKLNLSEYIQDEDGHKLIYDIRSGDTDIAKVSLKGEELEIKAEGLGGAQIRLNVKDTQNASLSTLFDVFVAKDALVYVAYPIPAQDFINIRLSDDINSNVDVKVMNSLGREVMSKNISQLPDDKILTLDLKKLSSGIYVLFVKSGGKEYKQTFAKQ